MNEDLVFFESDDGGEYAFSLVRSFFYNGNEYALMREVNGEDQEEEEYRTGVRRIGEVVQDLPVVQYRESEVEHEAEARRGDHLLPQRRENGVGSARVAGGRQD